MGYSAPFCTPDPLATDPGPSVTSRSSPLRVRLEMPPATQNERDLDGPTRDTDNHRPSNTMETVLLPRAHMPITPKGRGCDVMGCGARKSILGREGGQYHITPPGGAGGVIDIWSQGLTKWHHGSSKDLARSPCNNSMFS